MFCSLTKWGFTVSNGAPARTQMGFGKKCTFWLLRQYSSSSTVAAQWQWFFFAGRLQRCFNLLLTSVSQWQEFSRFQFCMPLLPCPISSWHWTISRRWSHHRKFWSLNVKLINRGVLMISCFKRGFACSAFSTKLGSIWRSCLLLQHFGGWCSIQAMNPSLSW